MASGVRGRARKPDNLYRRGSVYYGRIQVGGRELRRSLKTADRREAKLRLEQWLAEQSPYHGTTRRKFADAALLWWADAERRLKPKTLEGYHKLLRGLTDYFGEHYWDQVNKATLQAFMEERRRIGSGIATVNRYLTVVSSIADHVRELEGWPDLNPVLSLPKKSRKARAWVYVRPPPEHIDFILSKSPGPFGDLCRFTLATGMRRDEVRLLPRVKVRDGRAQLDNTKSGFRVIELSPDALAIVKRQPAPCGSETLFNTKEGATFRRVTENWRETVRRAQQAAQREGWKLHTLRFHDLRHEYAIRELERGRNIYALKEHLGHSTVRQTEAYLQYLTPEQAARARLGTAH